MKDRIRIANAGGFWGDDLGAFKRQISGGDLDYITADYLAEITMSILKKQQNKNPELGYVTDFIDQMVEIAPDIRKKGVKIITNAGGINPIGCGKKLQEELKKIGIHLKIVVISGDDIIEDLDCFYQSGIAFKNMETDEDFDSIKNKVQSANVYLGIPPLIKALEQNADIIIAGRVTDTSITMAPMVYEFDWKLNDWDKLASGLIAGHIIECGAQGSGGNYTDWEKVENWNNFGYPIVEVYPDSTFIVTKHDNTGGLINEGSIKEQLLYEMGNPKFYISPDVVVDFTSIQLNEIGINQVKVSGIKGMESTQFLKVSMAYENGYTSSGSIIISNNEALKKAKLFEKIFWERLNIRFEKQDTSYVGYNSCHKDLVASHIPNEILLRFSVYDNDKSKLIKFGKSLAPLILSGPPGVAVTSGRPRIHTVMSYWPALIHKLKINAKVFDLDNSKSFVVPSVTNFEGDPVCPKLNVHNSSKDFSTNKLEFKNSVKVKLFELCQARSGDKGDMANIGVASRNKEIYLFLKEHLTANFVKNIFKNFCKGQVVRYELDNLNSLNFLLEEALDGGGTESLLIDAQGKTLASALLNIELNVPMNIYESLKKQ